MLTKINLLYRINNPELSNSEKSLIRGLVSFIDETLLNNWTGTSSKVQFLGSIDNRVVEFNKLSSTRKDLLLDSVLNNYRTTGGWTITFVATSGIVLEHYNFT